MNLKTPKVGDRVKVVGGHEGVVTTACPPTYTVRLGFGYYRFYDGELEVIEKEVNGL